VVKQVDIDIADVCRKQLLEEGAIRIPKVGVIKVKHIGSEIHRQDNGQLLLSPPSKGLVFEPASRLLNGETVENESSPLGEAILKLSQIIIDNHGAVINGVGTFTKHEDWGFEPSDSLIRTISYRESRLPVVDLSGNYVATDDARQNLQLDIDETEIPDQPDKPRVIEKPKEQEQVKNPPKSTKNSEWKSYAAIAAVMTVLILVSVWIAQYNKPSQASTVTASAPKEVIVEPKPAVSVSIPDFVMKGNFQSDMDEFYTLVLFSLRSRSNAEEVAAELRTNGYNAFLQEFQLQNRPAYRVAVGQFQSIELAQEHIPQLPQEFRNSNFIRRFNQNKLIIN
jgi:cell division septation protein DedD